VEESIRMREDREKWRKYVHGVSDPRIEDEDEDGYKEQNRTLCRRPHPESTDRQRHGRRRHTANHTYRNTVLTVLNKPIYTLE